jgi:hypothetical protein
MARVNFKRGERKEKKKKNIADNNLPSNKTREPSLEGEDATGNPMTQ